MLAGTLLGLVAGFFRRLDALVMRVVDAMMSFPDILLAIALVGILGPSMLNVVLARRSLAAAKLEARRRLEMQAS